MYIFNNLEQGNPELLKKHKRVCLAKLKNESWDGSNSHAEKILSRVVNSRFALDVYYNLIVQNKI